MKQQANEEKSSVFLDLLYKSLRLASQHFLASKTNKVFPSRASINAAEKGVLPAPSVRDKFFSEFKEEHL